MGIWWHRITPHLDDWIHPCAFGGIPNREAIEAAWEAQFDLQRARTNKEEMVIVELDYYKFFDKFDPDFMYQFMSKLGFPQTMLTN